MAAGVITGRIVLKGWTGELGPAKVTVRLLDTSRIDAPARTIAERVLPEVRLDRAAQRGIPFRLDVPALGRGVRREVGVHVDLAGDGLVRRGDYVNMQAFPVPALGRAIELEVEARRVG